MADISYFQKYSQRENHITNNTMLMFRHLYRQSPLRFEKLLKEMISDATIDIGLLFSQQIKAENSVPDALITQKPVHIFIEAKADGELYHEQIERHIQSIIKSGLPKGSAVLIGLVKNTPDRNTVQKFYDICGDKGIHFALATYNELLDILKTHCADHEADLQEIIDDYEDFLRTDGMLPNPYEMVVFPCGTSRDENIKYQIYYESARKPSKAHVPFIGIYNNKTITHIGRIKGTCVTVFDTEVLSVRHESGTVTQADRDKIREVVQATDYYDLNKGCDRYYMIEALHEVHITKKSSGGMRGHRYIDLQKLAKGNILTNDTTRQIAHKIQNTCFL